MNNVAKRCMVLMGLFVFLCVHSFAQADKSNIDSVKAYIQKLSSDSDKVNTLVELGSSMDCDDSIKKVAIASEAKRIAEHMNWPKGIRASNRLLGDIYFRCQKSYARAFEHYLANVEYSRKNNDIQHEV